MLMWPVLWLWFEWYSVIYFTGPIQSAKYDELSIFIFGWTGPLRMVILFTFCEV